MFCRCVARLGADAADALDHAHGLGIIHRDVKPANLLIDQNGAVWITDFGLARFHSDFSLTGTDDIVGTLRYMSPEQALARRGVVDQRTDVYALGVTLYELLTLRPAFDGRDHQELLRQIALDEPVSPRRLNPAIPRDLETIILKAMAKDVSSRYATAQEMAGDLRRFLDDQPIVARRPGILECTWRWARRHGKQLASAAAIVMVLLIITTAVCWRFYVSSRESRNRYLAYLIKNYPLIDRFAIDQVHQEASLLATSTDPTTRKQAYKIFDEVIELFKQASELPPTNRESRIIIARAFCRLASTRTYMSFCRGTMQEPDPTLMSAAFSDYRESIARFEGLVAESGGDVTVRRYLADALGLGGMGCYKRLASQPKEAEQFYSRAIQLRRDLLRGTDGTSDKQDRPRLEVSNECDDPLWLVRTVHTLTSMLDGEGRKEEAERLRRQSEEDFIAVAARYPMPEFQGIRKLWADQLMKDLNYSSEQYLDCRLTMILDPERAEALNTVAWFQARFPDDASFKPEQALISAQKAVALEPSNWLYLNTLGVAAFRVGDWKTAEKSLRESIGFNGGRAEDWFFLAMTRWRQGECQEARRWFDQAVSWVSRNKSSYELRRFHAEAAALLGLPEPDSKQSTRKIEKSKRITPEEGAPA